MQRHICGQHLVVRHTGMARRYRPAGAVHQSATCLAPTLRYFTARLEKGTNSEPVLGTFFEYFGASCGHVLARLCLMMVFICPVSSLFCLLSLLSVMYELPLLYRRVLVSDLSHAAAKQTDMSYSLCRGFGPISKKS